MTEYTIDTNVLAWMNSEILNPLGDFDVTPVFLIQDVPTLQERYMAREQKPFPAGHVTRQQTYANRAEIIGAFTGDSTQALHHLKVVAARDLARRCADT